MATTFERIQLNRKTAAQWTAANIVLLAGEAGVELDTGKVKFGDGVNPWTGLPYTTGDVTAGVASVNSRTGTVTLTKTDVGLSNVDNTSDAGKPVSTAQAAAIASKATYPAGGVDGQALVKSGTSTAWATVSGKSSGDEVTLTDYLPPGYVTDGSVAYDTAWDAALAAGAKLYVPAGTWLLAAVKTIPNTVASIRLHPKAVVRTTVIGSWPFQRTGTAAATSTPITGGTKGSITVTVGSATGITTGTWLWLTADDPYPNDATQSIAFLRRVTAITGTTVTLDSPLFRTMTTAPRAYIVTLAPSLRLEGGTWEHGNPTAVTGTRALWHFQLTERPTTVDVTIQKNGGAGLQLDNCVGGIAQNTHFLDLIDDPTNNHYGYGIVWAGATRDHVWLSGSAARIRHGVTTGGATIPITAITDQRGEPDSCKVLAGVTVSDTKNAAFDTHSAGFNIQFLGPTAINTGLGAESRSDETIIDIITVGTYLYGAQILASATNTHVRVQMRNPSPAKLPGAVAIRNSGTGTRIGPSEQLNPPTGWGAIQSDTDYVLTGPGRLDGYLLGAGNRSYAALDFSGDTAVPGGAATSSTNSQSGSAYILAVSDGGNIVENSGTGILTITVPTDTAVPLPVGSVIELNNYSTGSIILTAASGVTLRSPSGLRLVTQYASAAIRKRSTTEWIVSGLTVV